MREQGWLMCGGESGEVWGEGSEGRHCGREVWGGICVCMCLCLMVDCSVDVKGMHDNYV